MKTRSAFPLSMKAIGGMLAVTVVSLLVLAYNDENEPESDADECQEHDVRAVVEVTGGRRTRVEWKLGEDSGNTERSESWSRTRTVRCEDEVSVTATTLGSGGDPICELYLNEWRWAVDDPQTGRCSLVRVTP